MKVAVFGCLHGMLDAMYDAIEDWERRFKEKVDFVIVCGDCQTLRHKDDLVCLSVPEKYKKLGDFHQYYSGQRKIPKLTIFVGGNHEASNYLMTLPYGGWVCENFYYLGYAGVINYKGLRIAGISGIYNHWNINKGRYETMPLNQDSIRSIYHTRQLDVFRLQLLAANAEITNPIDVFLSHDWPRNIHDYGNKEQLMRFKPAFRNDIQSKEGLGNASTQPLIKQLKPRHWFAAHLHCKFTAKVKHDENRFTEFLSLNKIENRKNFMEVLDIEQTREYDNSDNDLYYDEEWLTVLRKTINLESSSNDKVFCPKISDNSAENYLITEQDIEETINLMNKCSDGFKIPRDFKMTEPVIYNRPNGVQPSLDCHRTRFYPNPQTEKLISKIKLVKTNQDDTQSSSHKMKQEQSIKKENDIKKEIKLEVKHEVKQQHDEQKGKFKIEIISEHDRPIKKVALSQDSLLDEDGCLPFCIDKNKS